MEKIWLNQYPAGVPHEINPDAESSIVEVFDQAVKEFADRPAVSNFGTVITYRELDKRANAFGAYLQNELGLKKGDRFAIMMPNLIQYLVAMFGALKAGLTIVNVNPLYTARELSHQLNDSGAKAMIVLSTFAETVAKAQSDLAGLEHVIVTKVGDSFSALKGCIVNFVIEHIKKMSSKHSLRKFVTFKDVMCKGAKMTLTPVELRGDDLAYLQYTGGTTGVAKGAMLTHRNMIANIEQAYGWMLPFIERGNETIITALPLYHIFSLLANCLVFMKCGSHNVLITNPRDIKSFIGILSKEKFTAVTGVNTLFNVLSHHEQFGKLDFSNLKIVLGGGMAVQRAVADQWKHVTGVHILEAYGLTETSPAVTINPLNLPEYNGSIGLPVPSTDIKIIDDEGNELGINQPGELCVKGPQVMSGYWNRPDETANVLSDDGWLKTGDIAKVDEKGFVFIVDRKKDMVDVSGFNVYPNEIEEVLAQHPDILEVAVIGVKSELTGEALKAFIVSENESLSSKDVIAYCRQRLTAYKVPKIYEFRDELPKSNVGKILRRTLREEEMNA